MKLLPANNFKEKTYVQRPTEALKKQFIEFKKNLQNKRENSTLAKYCEEKEIAPMWDKVTVYSYCTRTGCIGVCEMMLIHTTRKTNVNDQEPVKNF